MLYYITQLGYYYLVNCVVFKHILVSQVGHGVRDIYHDILLHNNYFEISRIRKYSGKWSICFFGANARLSIIFSKVFKT